MKDKVEMSPDLLFDFETEDPENIEAAVNMFDRLVAEAKADRERKEEKAS